MNTLSINEKPKIQIVDYQNMYDFPNNEFCKWSADGSLVYLKRVFENGQILYTRFDINDPGQSETPITRQAYTSVRCQEFQR